MNWPGLRGKKVRWQPTWRDCAMALVGALVAVIGVWAGSAENKLTPLAATSSRVTIPWLPDTVRHWEQPIGEMARRYNIDANLLAIIMTLESGGYADAQSHVGAEGLMQVTPPTAKDIAARYVREPRKDYNLKDPRTSIEFGAAYLAMLRKEFGSSDQEPNWDKTVELIAAGYNGGPGAASALEKGEGLRSLETLSYSRDAFNMWRERHAASSPTYDRWKDRGGYRLLDLAKEAQK